MVGRLCAATMPSMGIAFSELFNRRIEIDGVTITYAVRDDAIDLEVHADRATARRLHGTILQALQPAPHCVVTSHYAGGSSEQIHP